VGQAFIAAAAMSSERRRRSGSKMSQTSMNSSAPVISARRDRPSDPLGPADDRRRQEVADGGALFGAQAGHEVFDRRLQPAPVAGEDAEHPLVVAAGEVFGFVVGGGRDERDADDHVGFGELGGGLELAAVELDGLQHLARREVRGEGVGQAPLGGQAGREQAGAEDPDRHLGVGAGHRHHALAGLHRAEELLHLGDFAGKSSSVSTRSRRSARIVMPSVPGRGRGRGRCGRGRARRGCRRLRRPPAGRGWAA
jgi:hypothetical protein